MTPFSLETCDLGEEQTKEESRYSNIESGNDEYDAIYFAKPATPDDRPLCPPRWNRGLYAGLGYLDCRHSRTPYQFYFTV
jgi:hypothetical protein